MIKKYLKKILLYQKIVLPGLAVFTIFFIYAIVFNMSFSYMGNTSKNVVDFIISHYILLIIISFIKIIAVYLCIGLALSIFFYYGITALTSLCNASLSNISTSFLTAALTFIIAFLQLCKSIVMYPQLYLDTIFNKNIIYKNFQILLTNNFSPDFFWAVQCSIVVPFIAAFVFFVCRQFFNHMKIYFQQMASLRNKKKQMIIACAIVTIVTISLLPITIANNKTTNKPNIIILASDALRPDHFSGYGYHRKTTPTIDTLIQQGTNFHNVYTVVPRTFPAWVSIVTSQLPMKHHISHMFPMAVTRKQNFITLPKILSQYGYHTSVVGDFAADIFPRIDLGYDTVMAPTFNMRVMIQQIILKNHTFLLPFLTNKAGFYCFPEIKEFAEFADPEFVVQDIKTEINKSIKTKKPFFITSFFSITHFPYPARYPYYNLFTDRHYSGPFKYSKNRVVSLNSEGEAHEYSPSDNEVEHIRALYDGCIYAFDEAVGKVIQYCKDKNIYDNTIIIILSDHGENLYEYDYGMGHGEHLRGKYSMVIPCIFAGPGIPYKHHSAVRSAIDIAPTILDLLDIQQPESFDGTSLLKKHKRNFDAYCETGIWFDNTGNFFFQKKRIMYPNITGISTIDFNYHDEITVTPYYEYCITIAKHRCIIANNYKLIYMPTHYGIEYELYDLSNDIDESNNIFTTSPQSEMLKKQFFSLFNDDKTFTIYNEYLLPVIDKPIF